MPFLLCLILGFSATLSDGWSVSLWVNGSILSLCILLIFELSNSYKFKVKKFDYSYLSQILIILIIFFIPYSENTEARDNYTYRDLSDNSKLTYNLNNLNKYYGNIYTSKNVYNYLESLQKCIGLIDNKNISVYPDNPIIYSMYNLKNPLIIDRYEGYFVSTDYDDIKLYENIAALNSNKDASYAIFLQTYPTSKLIEIDSQNINLLNDRNSTGFHPEILQSIEFIKTNLEGDKATCDSFEIIYKNIEY